MENLFLSHFFPTRFSWFSNLECRRVCYFLRVKTFFLLFFFFSNEKLKLSPLIMECNISASYLIFENIQKMLINLEKKFHKIEKK